MVRLFAACCIFLACQLAQADTRDPGVHFFQQSLGDFADELKTAKAEGKKGVMLMFEMEECPFCTRMKQTVLNQVEVQDWYRRHFAIFSVDTEGAREIADFSGRSQTEKKFALDMRVRATPVFIFFDLAGKPVTRFTGAAKDGAEFLLLGRYVVEGAYEQMPFAKYKQTAR